jgi:hypothetical protein
VACLGVENVILAYVAVGEDVGENGGLASTYRAGDDGDVCWVQIVSY